GGKPSVSTSISISERAMINTINAAAVMNEPEFKTPTEAIRFSQSHPKVRYSDEVASCVDRVIISLDWFDKYLNFYLGDNILLNFYCNNNVVHVGVKPVIGRQPDRPREDAILLRFGDKKSLWKKRKIESALCGNRIRAIQPTKSWYFLDVEN